jgi:hypothetical protein
MNFLYNKRLHLWQYRNVMTETNDEHNEEPKKPVRFHRETDILGLEKGKDKSTEVNNAATEAFEATASLTLSEYQSVKHFLILNFFSFGLYTFFWMFKHWQYLRDEKGRDINASFRTMFTFIYGYALFKEFEALAVEKGYHKKLPLGLLFFLYILSVITCNLPGGWFLLYFLMFMPLIPVLRMMNFYYVKEQEGYSLKRKLTKGEKLFLALIWGSLIAMFFMEAGRYS